MRGTIPTGRFDQRIALARDNGWSSCARCAADRVFLNATAAAATGAEAPLPAEVLQSVSGAAVAARSKPPVASRNTSALHAIAPRRFIDIPRSVCAAALAQYLSHRATARRTRAVPRDYGVCWELPLQPALTHLLPAAKVSSRSDDRPRGWLAACAIAWLAAEVPGQVHAAPLFDT